MTRSRIGQADSSAGRDEPRRSLVTRAGDLLASPSGIAITIPLLVLVLGAVLVYVGEFALRSSSVAAAHERLGDSATLVARSVNARLELADRVLDGLEILVRRDEHERDLPGFAHALAARMSAVRGVSFLSVSFPDGRFLGAYLGADGRIRFQDSRVEADGTLVRRYVLVPDGTIRLEEESRGDYDPRERAFYRRALELRRRTWTDPYVFYPTRATGVSRVEPFYADDGQTLRAVLTVDYDVHSLSSFLRYLNMPDSRALIADDHGSLLAAPLGERALANDRDASDRPLGLVDLRDPVLESLARRPEFVRHVQGDRGSTLAFAAEGERYLAALASCSPEAGRDWKVIYVVPERAFLGALARYQTRSLTVAFVALLVAVAVAWLFGRHITRVREEAAKARRAANELGSYRLVEQLGEGGMGSVWRAEHRLLARGAAVKLIQSSFLTSNQAEAKSRFKREAEALASLRSRHTIEIYDYGVAEDGTFFFVMELLDGLDLETLVGGSGRLPAGRVASILAQVCSSLGEAHERGMVHRDVKPANVFLCRVADEVDVVKVLDFGLVTSDHEEPVSPLEQMTTLSSGPSTGSGRLTRFGNMIGTPGFMAPEQIHGQLPDGRADLYALGSVGFFLLTGTHLFDDDSPMKVLMDHLDRPTDEVRRLIPPDVPAEMVELLVRCLAKSKEDRPASAAEVRRELLAMRFEGIHAWSTELAEAWWTEHERLNPKAAREGDFTSARTLYASEG